MTSLAHLLALAVLVLPRLLVPQGLTVSVCLCDLLAWGDTCGACELVEDDHACCCDVEVPSCCCSDEPATPLEGEALDDVASCDGCLSVELDELEVSLGATADAELAPLPPLAAVVEPVRVAPAVPTRATSPSRAPPGVARTPAERAGALPLRN